MKVVKKKWVRLLLYIAGLLCTMMIAATVFAEVLRCSYYSSDLKSDWASTYEESETVKKNVRQSIENVQRNVKTEQSLNAALSDNDFVRLYDYRDLADDKTFDPEKDAKDEAYTDIIGSSDVIDSMRSYLNSRENHTEYGEVYYPDYPQNSSYIRIDWQDYKDMILANCIRFNRDDYAEATGEKEIESDGEYTEEELYEKLREKNAYYGISDGDYFTFFGDCLYIYFGSDDMIYNADFGYKHIIDFKNIYVLYTESFADAQKSDKALECEILKSYPITSGEELVYGNFSDEQRVKLASFDRTLNHDAYYSFNSAYSYDGEKVEHSWIFNDEGIGSIERSTAGYNITYDELKELFAKTSSIYISYSAKTGEFEQWYIDPDDGTRHNYEFIKGSDLKDALDCNEDDFVLSLNDGEHGLLFQRTMYSYAGFFSHPVIILIITAGLFLAIIILLTMTAEARMRRFDRIPYICFALFYFSVLMILRAIAGEIGYMYSFNELLAYEPLLMISGIIFTIIVMYVATAALFMSIARRIKCRRFIDGFLSVKIVKWFIRKIRKLLARIPEKKKAVLVIAGAFLVNAIALILFCGAADEEVVTIVALLLIAVEGVIAYNLIKYATDMDVLLKAGKRIEDGELDAKVNTDELTFNGKEMGETLNNLGSGLSKAVEASIRDERTKAELITNVSHDIKTPLTSIINYVDLLKKEDIDNEKARGYIEVLDQKSERLKNLILDLIEVSKASTGNIELECMDLNILQLLSQVMGEYEDKYAELGLEIVETKDVDNAIINADGRRVFRIIDNVLGNVSKYALPGTRVYVDVENTEAEAGKQWVSLRIKNVSRQMLNITADELMERFVRGDRSRHTEGSGLGLSIAKNLTELQGGTFDLKIDGDLFVVTVGFPTVE